MQTTILKKDFINALTIGGAMAGKNKTLPILEFAKVEVSADAIAVHSFNGESWVTKQTKVESADTTFAFCINPNDLAKVLKSLVEEVVTFAIRVTCYAYRISRALLRCLLFKASSTLKHKR